MITAAHPTDSQVISCLQRNLRECDGATLYKSTIQTILTFARDYDRRPPWDYEAAIQSDMGALSIHLAHVCASSHRPTCVAEFKGHRIFKFSGATSNIYLVSKHPLDELIKPKEDHLFFLDPRRCNPNFPLLLRTLKRRDSTWTIVAPCTNVLVENTTLDIAGSRIYFPSISFHLQRIRDLLKTRPLGSRPGYPSHSSGMSGVACFFPISETL